MFPFNHSYFYQSAFAKKILTVRRPISCSLLLLQCCEQRQIQLCDRAWFRLLPSNWSVRMPSRFFDTGRGNDKTNRPGTTEGAVDTPFVIVQPVTTKAGIYKFENISCIRFLTNYEYAASSFVIFPTRVGKTWRHSHGPIGGKQLKSGAVEHSAVCMHLSHTVGCVMGSYLEWEPAQISIVSSWYSPGD